MTYRDDHDAALARADALEAELRAAKSEHDHDQEKIAELESKLSAPKVEPPPPRKTAPAPEPDYYIPDPPKPPTTFLLIEKRTWLIGGFFAVALLCGFLYNRCERNKVADGWDVQANIDEAISEARSTWSDAELATFYADYVDSKGHALILDTNGGMSFYFRSASHPTTSRTPSRPGMPPPTPKADCLIESAPTSVKKGTSLRESKNYGRRGCDESLPGKPRCSIVEIWQRAIDKGAPSNGVAKIRMWTSNRARNWKFEMDGTPHTYRFADDCH